MSANHSHRPISWLIILLVALIVIVPLLMVLGMYFAVVGSGPSTDFGMMGSFGGAWWPFMMIMPIIAVLVIVALIYLVVEEPSRPVQYAQALPPPNYGTYGAQGARTDEPLAILDRRLASGQIGIDEYNRLKDELRKR